MNCYYYPDVNDELTSLYIRRYGKLWRKEEELVLDIFKHEVRRSFGDDAGVAVDVGCGKGRLIGWVYNELNPNT
jgi:2-polyprenyl-3-methyl-5-hydroxy-6-metoxy-1,4-benzoquinol methylase